MGWTCEHKTVVQLENSAEADLRQKKKKERIATVQDDLIHQNTRTRLTDSSLLDELSQGAFIILYAPCRFCFAWPEFWKVFIFIYFELHAIWFISTARKKKDPVFTCSNCTCFTASSIKIFVKQTVRRKKKKKNWKENVEDVHRVIHASRGYVLLYNVFTVNHAIWNRCTKCML